MSDTQLVFFSEDGEPIEDENDVRVRYQLRGVDADRQIAEWKARSGSANKARTGPPRTKAPEDGQPGESLPEAPVDVTLTDGSHGGSVPQGEAPEA